VLAIGILLAAGQYGPFWLPQTFFHCGFFLFSGTSVFTTFLVALLVREEARAASHLCDRRDMLMHNRIKLSLAFILCVGFDGSIILIGVFPQIRSVADSLLGIVFAGLIIGQGFSSAFFVLQASSLRSVLLEFMHQSTEQVASSRATISRLMCCLWVVAIACAGSTINMIHFSALWFKIYSPGRNTELHWFLLVFSMCSFRLFVSISKIQVVKPRADTRFGLWSACLARLRKSSECCKKNRVVAVGGPSGLAAWFTESTPEPENVEGTSGVAAWLTVSTPEPEAGPSN